MLYNYGMHSFTMVTLAYERLLRWVSTEPADL